MKAQELDTWAKAAELLDGAVYDREQINIHEAVLLADILAENGFRLKEWPEMGLVYAVPASGGWVQ